MFQKVPPEQEVPCPDRLSRHRKIVQQWVPPAPLILLAVVLCVAGFIGITFLQPAWSEHHRVRTYRPVPAILLSSWQERGVRKVIYRYAVDGRPYTAETIFPLERVRADGNVGPVGMINRYYTRPDGRLEARATMLDSLIRDVDGYRVGQQIIAYYDPTGPHWAFLIPACFFHPFAWIFPLGLTVVTAVIGYSVCHSRVPGGARGRRLAQVAVAIVWLLIGAAVYRECFPPDETLSSHWGPIFLLLAGYQAIGLAILGIALSRMAGARRSSRP
jgi:uncharacterized protein DUF3592